MNYMPLVITLVRWFFDLLTLIVFIDVMLSYFLAPYHPIREALDKIVQPMLNPIRRIVPTVGMVDFSPVVLLLIIQVVEFAVVSILRRIG